MHVQKTPNVLPHACVWVFDSGPIVLAGQAFPIPTEQVIAGHWFVGGNFLVRIHHDSRPQHLIVPNEVTECKPTKEDLHSHRLTIVCYEDNVDFVYINGDWR